MRGIQDEGSLVAAAGHRHAAHLVYLGLLSLQHRAMAGVGLATSDGTSTIRQLVGPGLVHEVLVDRTVDQLDGPLAVGRLSGAPLVATHGPGATAVEEPVVRSWSGGRLAVTMAGRLTNGAALRQQVLGSRGVLAGASDAELVAHLIAAEDGRTIVNRVVAALHDLRGAFSMVVITEDKMIVARDPRGYRPLVLGALGSATVVASEDTALRDLGCSEIRSVQPGEIVIIDGGRALSLKPFMPKSRSASFADLAVLARDGAVVDGVSAMQARLSLGAALARERPAPGAAVVTGLPSAQSVAAGYADALGRPLLPALTVSRAQERLLPPPADVDDSGYRTHLRAAGVARAEVALVVPSLATGIEVEQAVVALRRAGARRIHLRVATPAIAYADPFGLSLPPPETLASVRLPLPEQLATGLGVDSAACLSLEGMRGAIDGWEAGWCDAAWSGELPEPAVDGVDQLGLFPTAD